MNKIIKMNNECELYQKNDKKQEHHKNTTGAVEVDLYTEKKR